MKVLRNQIFPKIFSLNFCSFSYWCLLKWILSSVWLELSCTWKTQWRRCIWLFKQQWSTGGQMWEYMRWEEGTETAIKDGNISALRRSVCSLTHSCSHCHECLLETFSNTVLVFSWINRKSTTSYSFINKHKSSTEMELHTFVSGIGQKR